MSTDQWEPTDSPRPSPYQGRTIAVGTKHGKQRQFAPAFADILGARLCTPAGLDTDRFGTFSGERPRTGPPLDAARAKARLAMEVGGLPYGLASEASYGHLPGIGCLGHEEILVFLDAERSLEVVEGYRTTVVPGPGHRVSTAAELPPSVLVGLPAQAVIVRPAGAAPGAIKGIRDARTLTMAVAVTARRSPDGQALVEPDLRAHHNPSRQRVLAHLARALAERLSIPCPYCAAPGFGRVAAEPGLPCRYCSTPTPLPCNEIHRCGGCGFTEQRALVDVGQSGGADPAQCPACNP